MKKIMLIVLVSLLSIFSACNIEESDNELHELRLSNTIMIQNHEFYVEIDKNEIIQDEVVEVSITLKVGDDISVIRDTSYYGIAGVIVSRLEFKDTEGKIFNLYDKDYDVQKTDDEFEIMIKSGESVTYKTQYGRLPFHETIGNETITPVGVYKLEVGIYNSEKIVWVDTKIVVEVRDNLNNDGNQKENDNESDEVIHDTVVVKNHEFYIEIDKNKLTSTGYIKISVTLTAGEDISIIRDTSYYGIAGIIVSGLVFTDDSGKTFFLYSEDYDIDKTDDEFDIMIKSGETVTYEMRYARLPFHETISNEMIAPIGIYKLEFGIYQYDEIEWIVTKITVEVIND